MSNHNNETEARCIHCFRHYVEGTAAWALYMMRMGHKITNPMYDQRVYHLPEGGMIHVNGIESIATTQWIDYWCIDIPDGWQLYEEPEPANPERWVCYECGIKDSRTGHFPGCSRIVKPQPQPAYAGGDWVEFIDAGGHKSQGKYLSKAYDNAILVLDITYNMRCVVPVSKITRKLDPSEVIVRIGCLRGTVTYAISDDCFLLAKVYDPQHRACCIDMSMLDIPTRELVEALLKAQEEK